MGRDIKTDQQLVQSVWPEWELMEEIGAGQFGMVYKARKHGFAGDSFSAIKVVKIDRDSDDSGFSNEQTDSYLASIAQNYAREIKMLEYVKGNSNIASIEDYTICQNSGGKPWYVLIRMELLKPLYDDLDGKEINDQLVIRIGKDLCRALEICAERQIVHRDIKPANVLVNDYGVYKLGDFGVARQITGYTSNTTTGTPDYMAPEVFKRSLKAADFERAHSADIYSLGMLLYWIANGKVLPFLEHGRMYTTEDKEKAFRRKMEGEQLPPPVKVSPPLQKVILKACAYDPKDRYRTAEEFREALESVGAGPPGGSGNRGLLTAVIAVCLVLLAAFVLESMRIIDIIKDYPAPTPTPTPIQETTPPNPEPTTPTPTPTPTPPTPTPKPTPKPWPKRTLTGVKTGLNTRDKGRSYQAFFGPGKPYADGAGAYKASGVRNATALFRESIFVLVDLDYPTGRQIVYFKKIDLTTLPEETVELVPYPSATVCAVTPLLGPGNQYGKVKHNGKEVLLDADTPVNVFFETEGWVFAEFDCSIGLIRAWLPADQV